MAQTPKKWQRSALGHQVMLFFFTGSYNVISQEKLKTIPILAAAAIFFRLTLFAIVFTSQLMVFAYSYVVPLDLLPLSSGLVTRAVYLLMAIIFLVQVRQKKFAMIWKFQLMALIGIGLIVHFLEIPLDPDRVSLSELTNAMYLVGIPSIVLPIFIGLLMVMCDLGARIWKYSSGLYLIFTKVSLALLVFGGYLILLGISDYLLKKDPYVSNLPADLGFMLMVGVSVLDVVLPFRIGLSHQKIWDNLLKSIKW